MSSSPRPPTKRHLHYKYICHECKECVEVPENNITVVQGIGAGRDYSGGYDSGTTEIRLKCTCCECISRLSEWSLEEALKKHLLFKVYK